MSETAGQVWRNWSGAVTAEPRMIVRPETEEQLAELVRNAPSPVRIVGSGHSFTPLVASNGTILDLGALSGIQTHDPARSLATVRAGTRLGDLTGLLHGIGQGLPNMGDIDRQTIGGALGTATHGSGLELGAYHTLLRTIRLVDGRGNMREYTLDGDPDMVHAMGVTLGVFGALTSVTLQNRPAYRLRRRRTAIPVGDVLQNFESLMSSHRSAEFFLIPFSSHALYLNYDITADAPTARAEESDEEGLATLRTLRNILKWFPWLRRKLIGTALSKIPPEDFVEDWCRIYVSDRRTRFNEMEYHLPFEEGAAALGEIYRLLETRFPEVYFPVEVRTVDADEFWLSPFYRRKSCSIAIHHDARESSTAFFAAAEAIFQRRGGRPHWGKMHSLKAEQLSWLYPRLADAMAVRREIDPENRFISPYIAGLLEI